MVQFQSSLQGPVPSSLSFYKWRSFNYHVLLVFHVFKKTRKLLLFVFQKLSFISLTFLKTIFSKRPKIHQQRISILKTKKLFLKNSLLMFRYIYLNLGISRIGDRYIQMYFKIKKKCELLLVGKMEGTIGWALPSTSPMVATPSSNLDLVSTRFQPKIGMVLTRTIWVWTIRIVGQI